MTTETAVKARPISFNAEMVNALLAGRKTMTRRIVKPQPLEMVDGEPFKYSNDGNDTLKQIECPYGEVGSQLYVREGLQIVRDTPACDEPKGPYACYAADGSHIWHKRIAGRVLWRWQKPTLAPMFMPRILSRITLEIAEIRVERVCEISNVDALAEGCESNECPDCDGSGDEVSGEFKGQPCANCSGEGRLSESTNFRRLWQSIHGDDEVKSWQSNPYVWAISFRVIEPQVLAP